VEILSRIRRLLDERFHISHTTIQFEHKVCDTPTHCYVPEAEQEAHSREHSEQSRERGR
jgi:hypothetical protein